MGIKRKFSKSRVQICVHHPSHPGPRSLSPVRLGLGQQVSTEYYFIRRLSLACAYKPGCHLDFKMDDIKLYFIYLFCAAYAYETKFHLLL